VGAFSYWAISQAFTELPRLYLEVLSWTHLFSCSIWIGAGLNKINSSTLLLISWLFIETAVVRKQKQKQYRAPIWIYTSIFNFSSFSINKNNHDEFLIVY